MLRRFILPQGFTVHLRLADDQAAKPFEQVAQPPSRIFELRIGESNPTYWSAQVEPRDWRTMKSIRNLMAMIAMTFVSFLTCAQSAAPPRITPSDAKNHVGDQVTVCGKVVDTRVTKYGIAGSGKPVIFDLDQPEPNPVFYFVTFGAASGGPQEAISAYKDKSVCVTGKVAVQASVPFIMARDRSKIKPLAEDSK